MLKIALVGCGKAGENHAREIAFLPEAVLVSVCDVEPMMAEQFAARFDVPRHYAEFTQMISRERPDVVHIATPPQSHVPLAMAALNAGCHVVIEKPLAMNHSAAEALIWHALRQQRKLTIAHSYHFDPICRLMRVMLQDGIIGEPVHVESFMGYALDGNFGLPVFTDVGHWVHELPGKLAHNVIDHLLNKITEFLPDDRPHITAHAWQRDLRGGDAFAMPDELRIMLKGARVSAYATFSAHSRPVSHYLTVFGTRNTLHLDFVAGTLTRRSTPSLPGSLGRLSCGFDQAWKHAQSAGSNVVRFVRGDYDQMSGLRYLFASFYRCIRECTSPPIPYADILRVSAIVDEVFAQCPSKRLQTA
ncbi:MAG: Gfo/Idh/MocA family oxidoreductase [Gemmatimonadaceae bacterium]